MSNTTPTGPGGPEHLESSAGSPVASPERSSDNRKRIIALGGIAGLVVVGGGVAWAVTSFMGTGSQPSEALPANTIGYVSIDLDPSGGQKIEAIKTMRKFPAFKDEINLDTDDDVREAIVEAIVDSGECKGLDYAKDVEPWLGNRAAIAATDTGEEDPTPVFVLQVTDADKASEGLANVREVCGGSEDSGGWVVAGDWVVIGETEAIAQKIVDASDEGTLADDADFQKWTGEAGDAGIMSMYVAPAAGDYLSSYLDGMGGLFGGDDLDAMGEFNPETGEFETVEPSESESEPVSPEMKKSLEEFAGAAATVRFSSGSLEVEFAGDAGSSSAALLGSDAGGDAVANLPDDTLAAFGTGFADGWFDKLIEQAAATTGETPDELLATMSEESGLDLPADAETLVGDALAISMGGGFDLEKAFNGGADEVPVGVTIKGDPTGIEAVLEKIRPQMGSDASLLETETGDDTVVISPNSEYRSTLAKGGSLGDTDQYQAVVKGIDNPSAVLFVNFDTGDDWLTKLVSDDDPEMGENVKPLSAFGIAGWREGSVSHGIVRLTTN